MDIKTIAIVANKPTHQLRKEFFKLLPTLYEIFNRKKISAKFLFLLKDSNIKFSFSPVSTPDDIKILEEMWKKS